MFLWFIFAKLELKSNYLKSYSASKSKGGGVLLDLSHEIDYINWLFGSFDVELCI